MRVLKYPPSLEGGNFDAILSLKIMEVLRYKESLCQWMYKEREMSLTFLISLLVIYKNGCYVHLRVLSAVENNFAGEPLGVSSPLCILELSRLTRIGRQSKHNYNCNIQGVSVYTNVSANYMFRPLLVRPSSGWIPRPRKYIIVLYNH